MNRVLTRSSRNHRQLTCGPKGPLLFRTFVENPTAGQNHQQDSTPVLIVPRTLFLGALTIGVCAATFTVVKPSTVRPTVRTVATGQTGPETVPAVTTTAAPDPGLNVINVPVTETVISTTTVTGSTQTTRGPIPANKVQAAAKDPSLAPVCGPVSGVAPGGAGCRIIAYYGSPVSKKLGVLGASPKAVMLADLALRTKMWQTADAYTPTRCGLEVIAITAQAAPGAGGLYRSRLSAKTLNEMLAWARESKCLLILDVQVGASDVPTELAYLAPWLSEPEVQLALDPEWDMPPGVVPGTKIGTMSAADIQYAIDVLSAIVKTKNLDPKMLIVHRFRGFMVSNPEKLKPTPEIRLLVNADGFGPPAAKLATFAIAKAGMPTQLTGFKLFFKNDKPMLAPKDVLPLTPIPVFINYQ
jgi:hypothetical protein